ncbi:hypothetical protein MIND_01381000 [Mycena indigotica]|uniref:Uncharacterized protein n=1 Tax=Mycena indigotica TaxID=2126181 RepID=A0A8H6RYD8_9AGAR|nr:uncharacterized protein MIND_01381000 [Mycena indigotica]KAF7289198.1 hypothetical protein MIND_01381000 [Mycena indigotica]
MLDKKAVNALISLINRVAASPAQFTVKNYDDLNKRWEQASQLCTSFKEYTVEVEYKGQPRTFEMHARPLWDWSLDLVQDPQLAPYFFWDAERRFRFDGTSWVPFYTEPWTGSAFWDAQSALDFNPDYKILPFILYADKAKLSTFGTQKGYPIIARLANVTVGIRNGTGWGGGQIVGWLPIVDEDANESGKPGFTNFKNAVWHEAFYKLLEDMAKHSNIGVWVRCGDGKMRKLFPMILILAADYEEAAVMALIRGVRALYPCPICLVKAEDLSRLDLAAPLRSTEDSEAVYHKAASCKTVEQREDELKAVGLRNVENVFWKVGLSDPYHALSFDRLHSHHSGLWGDHLFGQLKQHLILLGPRKTAVLDQQFDALPRWRNLNHFSAVSNISFNDGNKHRDISKGIIFAVHNILTDNLGLLLLRCIRSYLVVDTYLDFGVQTANTVEEGRKELQRFGQLINEYSDKCKNIEKLAKNWNFPKNHLQKHAFDDILRKGATKNFGTKIDESMHGPVRDAYHNLTNGKDVAPQILRFVHRSTVATYIREQIEDLDALNAPPKKDNANEDSEPDDSELIGNSVLGGKRVKISFSMVEEEHKTDVGFSQFRTKFTSFLNNFLRAFGHAAMDEQPLSFFPADQISPYGFVKVHFKSLDDWMDTTDYLRCSPNFHGWPRYDAVFVQTTTGVVIMRLVYVFAFEAKQKTFPFALVQPLDAKVVNPPAKDKLLGLHRIRAKPRRSTEFISVHSIIRGTNFFSDAADNTGKDPVRVAAGLKGTLARGDVSDEAKNNAQERLKDMGYEEYIAHPESSSDVREKTEEEKHENHVQGGYKATLKNPNVSEEAKENARQHLGSSEDKEV